jgi:hypothetical protein
MAQETMQLKRDEFAAEEPLRQAQIGLAGAHADYYRRMGTAQADSITKEWQYRRSLVPELSAYTDKIEELGKEYPIGSDDWWTARSPIDQEYSEVLATPGGMQLRNSYDTRGTRASAAIAQGQLRTQAQLDNAAAKYGIPMAAISSLQQAVDEPTKFQASAGGLTNDVWGQKEDGSRFAYFPKDDPKAQPASLAEINKLSDDEKANYRQITIEKPQVESIVSAARALSGPLRGNGVAPAWAYSLRGHPSQTTRKRVYDPVSGTYKDTGGGP